MEKVKKAPLTVPLRTLTIVMLACIPMAGILTFLSFRVEAKQFEKLEKKVAAYRVTGLSNTDSKLNVQTVIAEKIEQAGNPKKKSVKTVYNFGPAVTNGEVVQVTGYIVREFFWGEKMVIPVITRSSQPLRQARAHP